MRGKRSELRTDYPQEEQSKCSTASGRDMVLAHSPVGGMRTYTDIDPQQGMSTLTATRFPTEAQRGRMILILLRSASKWEPRGTHAIAAGGLVLMDRMVPHTIETKQEVCYQQLGEASVLCRIAATLRLMGHEKTSAKSNIIGVWILRQMTERKAT